MCCIAIACFSARIIAARVAIVWLLRGLLHGLLHGPFVAVEVLLHRQGSIVLHLMLNSEHNAFYGVRL